MCNTREPVLMLARCKIAVYGPCSRVRKLLRIQAYFDSVFVRVSAAEACIIGEAGNIDRCHCVGHGRRVWWLKQAVRE